MGTQDTFNLHIWGHEWGWGNLWKKLLPRLLPSRTQPVQVQSVGNVDAHVCAKEDNVQRWLLSILFFRYIIDEQHYNW